MGYEGKASFVMGPQENASGAESTLKFTCGTTHLNNAVPQSWEGNYVRITVTGGNMAYFFSSSSTAEVDATVAAADAGASGATVGDYLADGMSDHVVVPKAPVGGRIYFVREGSAASMVVRMRRAS